MRARKVLSLAVLALTAQVMASGCLLFPELKDKVVELATSGTVTADFHAQGVINSYTEIKTIDIRDSIDIAQVLDDAGIDVADVKSVTLGGVAYRITGADPTTGRQITNGSITVQRQGGLAEDLVANFTANADAVTGWITPTLDPAGVTELNNLLADILTELQGGAAANEVITYTVSGNSVPVDVSSDFTYQLRLTISVVGEVKVKTLE
jgi:hypothetical protein